MSEKIMKKSRTLIAALLGTVMIAALTIWGCGTSSYDSPTTIGTTSALIDASTLKTWIDQGKVNGTGFDRVVILCIGATDAVAPSGYAAGHIPGAIFVSTSEITQNRIEGVAVSSTMVLDGAKMDALVQKYGIDKNTTVVFTTNDGNQPFYATRGYATFRYWGFPKAKLKVLDGFDRAWKTAYGLTTDVPTVTPSTFSVRSNGSNNPGMRASLGEMMSAVVAGSASTAILDTRTSGYAGTPGGITTGVFAPTGDYTVFEGHIKGAQSLSFNSLMRDPANVTPSLSDFRIKEVGDVISLFNGAGMDATKKGYVYCRTGYIASFEFFVLDGLLGWDAVWYDGSWSQWGQMSTVATAKGGTLTPLAASWATDTATFSEAIFYNMDFLPTAKTIEVLPFDPLSAALFGSYSDSAANQIEKEDSAYMTGGAAGGSAAGAPASSGGGC